MLRQELFKLVDRFGLFTGLCIGEAFLERYQLRLGHRLFAHFVLPVELVLAALVLRSPSPGNTGVHRQVLSRRGDTDLLLQFLESGRDAGLLILLCRGYACAQSNDEDRAHALSDHTSLPFI